jgi:hypothetical protein
VVEDVAAEEFSKSDWHRVADLPERRARAASELVRIGKRLQTRGFKNR